MFGPVETPSPFPRELQTFLEQAVVAEPIGPTVIEESPCGHARRQRALECWQTHTEPDSAPGAMLGANLQALSAHGKQACVVAAWAASAR